MKLYLLPIVLFAAACDLDEQRNGSERNDAGMEREDRGIDGNGVNREITPPHSNEGVNTPGTVDPNNPTINDPSQVDNPPFQQSERAEDVKISADIRKAVLAEDGLSMSADTVQIITRDGVVLLLGDVASQQEKETVEKIAQQTAGVVRVDNRLNVGTQNPN